jgi:dinuclear metal center YbgI/SA1388 family protein
MVGRREERMTLEPVVRTLVETKEHLDSLLQVAGLDESGNGLIVGGRPQIRKVGLAVNCSWQAIEGAAERGCDLLITHHAAWTSTDAHLASEKYDRLRSLGINLYAAHDCLDRARQLGTADALARATKVTIQAPFKPDGESAFGVHGATAGAWPQFIVRVSSQLGTQARAWKNSDLFGRVAVIAGAGGRPEWMARALELGCDTLLTGEALMFGLLFAREAGLNLVLAGHYASETPGMMSLSARLARDLGLEVTFIPEDIVENGDRASF